MNGKTYTEGEFLPVDKEKNLYLLEFANPSEKNVETEFVNHSAIQYVLNNCEEFKFFLLLNASDL